VIVKRGSARKAQITYDRNSIGIVARSTKVGTLGIGKDGRLGSEIRTGDACNGGAPTQSNKLDSLAQTNGHAKGVIARRGCPAVCAAKSSFTVRAGSVVEEQLIQLGANGL
jgi:hypothetical protein